MRGAVKNLTFYIIMLSVCSFVMYWVIRLGGQLENILPSADTASEVSRPLSDGFAMFSDSLGNNVQSPVAMLLLQMIAILFVARIVGFFFVKIGQPSVIGEILAGIILGPSIFGYFFPDAFGFLFAPDSLGNINILSQIGLIFFMFVIGMELDIDEVKKKFNETLLISHSGIVFPFLCGVIAAYITYSEYAPETTPFLSYALFIGISMSITAFPVLARILQERGLTKTHLGTLSLASAANGDVTAWCLLAAVIAIAQTGTFVGALYTILFTALFLLIMFFIVRPFLNVIGNIYQNKEVINKTIVAFMFLILIISAYTTEILGIHALFGAFMAGVAMPSNIQFRKILTEKVEDVSLSVFLPLFFVSTGLKTEIGLIGSAEEWLICLLFIFVAIFGKMVGTVVPARFAGESWRDSWLIGTLMNTRGLMELIVLTIGYEMNILSPSIFTMLVIMTLVTTFMTGPMLSVIKFLYKGKEKKSILKKSRNKLHILLSFGRAASGVALLDVAKQVLSMRDKEIEITALHLTVGTDINPIHTEHFENESFDPLLEEAERLDLQVDTRYDLTNDTGQYIIDLVNKEAFDFLLVGAGISMSTVPEDVEAARYNENYYKKYFSKLGAPQSWFYPGELIKDKTHKFVANANSSVGIFINRDFEKATEVIVVLRSYKDVFLLKYAENLICSNRAGIKVIELGESFGRNEEAAALIRKFLETYPKSVFVRSPYLDVDLLLKQNFMLVSYESWGYLSEEQKETLQYMPSTLIIRK